MFDSKKMAEEIMTTCRSLKREERSKLLSDCGLSPQKTPIRSTGSAYRVRSTKKDAQKTNA